MFYIRKCHNLFYAPSWQFCLTSKFTDEVAIGYCNYRHFTSLVLASAVIFNVDLMYIMYKKKRWKDVLIT